MMEDLKEKFSQGIGSAIKGLETEKGKMELNKEVRELESKLNLLYNERGKKILKIGEEFYGRIRRGEVDNYDPEIIGELSKTDREIFNILKLIDDKISESKANLCIKCGASLDINSKFCKECGTAVEDKDDSQENMKVCNICNELNKEENKFCISCGNKF